MLTASSRSLVRTGSGNRSPMIRRNRLSGHCSRQALEAVRPTALARLRTSTGTRSCGRLEASLASSSARSLPCTPQWTGTHCRLTCLPPEAEVSRFPSRSRRPALTSEPRRRSRAWRALPASRCTGSAGSRPGCPPAAVQQSSLTVLFNKIAVV